MSELEGQAAPAFNLEATDGNTHSLVDYSGRTLVIYFYPKDNTPGCTKESCGFRDRYQDLLDAGIALLGVSRDSLASHHKFIDLYQLPFPLLSDPDHEMMAAYGAWGMKKMYGKEVEGTIRSTVVIGPDGTVLKHWARVRKAEEHPEQVMAFLAKL